MRCLWRTLHSQGVSNNVEPHAAVYDRQSIADLSISFSALYVRGTLACANQLAGSDRLSCRWVVRSTIGGQHPVAAQAFAATVAPCRHAASPYHLRPLKAVHPASHLDPTESARSAAAGAPGVACRAESCAVPDA